MKILSITVCSPRRQTSPRAAIWRNGRNIRIIFDFGLFDALYENDIITKLEVSLEEG